MTLRLRCRMDMLYEGARDLMMRFLPVGLNLAGPDETLLASARRKLDKCLPVFEKVMSRLPRET